MAFKITISLLLVALLVGSLITACFSGSEAQSSPKPSVPEFTVSITDHSYDAPTTTTTTTDFDGRKITTTMPGYHMVNGSITLSIKNQPFTPYYDADGYPINLYYHFRVGEGADWIYSGYSSDVYFEATNTTYTTVTLGYQGNFIQVNGGYSNRPSDGTVNFQVEAFIGHTNTTYRFSGAPIIRSEDYIVKYVGQTSGWSETQTATIPNGAFIPTTPNPTGSPTLIAPTQTATQPPSQDSTATPSGTQTASSSVEIQWNWQQPMILVVLGLVIALLIAVIAVMGRKIRFLESKQA
jgi:hypothetical protein